MKSPHSFTCTIQHSFSQQVSYKEQKQKLIAKVEKQEEKELDIYILPHPLLGKVTLREMLYVTIHHNEHHLQLLKNRI